MPGKLDELIAQLNAKTKTGISMPDQMVLRALQIPDVRTRVESMLGRGYSLVSASPLASPLPLIAQVLLQFNPPAGSAALGLPGIIVAFERESSRLVSISEEVQTPASPGHGAMPFALATPSFARAAGTGMNNPALMQRDARRGAFEGQFAQGGPFAGRNSSGTSVGCNQPTEYGTNEQYDTSGTPDWHTVPDYSQDWVIDDITNDDA